ncbi:hypothetical protein BSM4216_1996 [Bacillus smithii]|nr:hypothetical protein BSM4216_1996 [Bacillus smithii]
MQIGTIAHILENRIIHRLGDAFYKACLRQGIKVFHFLQETNGEGTDNKPENLKIFIFFVSYDSLVSDTLNFARTVFLWI